MKNVLIGFAAIFLIIGSCNRERKRPDITGIHVKLNIMRFEKDIFTRDLDSLPMQIGMLRNKYGEFFDIFNYKIIQIGSDKASAYPQLLKAYLTDFSVNQWYSRCNEVFLDVRFLEKGLTESFRYYKFYYPEKSIPEIVTFVGGLNQSVITSEQYLGVALDKYLGKDCELYQEVNPPVPEYLRKNMYKGKMVSDCMRGWLLSEFGKPDSLRTLLENMIYQGKILFLLKSILPDEPDSAIFGYEKKQIKWLERNERNMWTYLVENKLIFSTDQVRIKKFIDEAPFTRDFGRESPGQTGAWLGYKIVNAYMKKNEMKTVQNLISESDCLKMLESSRYDP